MEFYTAIQKNLCTPMFIAAQFTIAKYWKQPKCPSADEWIQKLWVLGFSNCFRKLFSLEVKIALVEREGLLQECRHDRSHLKQRKRLKPFGSRLSPF